MSDKFTSGPWGVEEMSADAPEPIRSFALVMAFGEEHVDVAYLPPCEDGEWQANALLVAAAPDLLAACRKALPIVEFASEWNQWHSAAEAADALGSLRDVLALFPED